VSVNDRVAVNANFTNPRFGAFQKYPLAQVKSLGKLPANVSFEDAAATVVNLKTIVGALAVYMGLDRPDLDIGRKPSNGKRVLVYGGSSSVGGFAIRYLADAGYDVVSTFSPQNKEFVSTLGANHLVNHKLSPEDQLKALQSFQPYDAVFDAIGTPLVINLLYKLLAPKGGVYYTTLPLAGGEDPTPEGVERKSGSFGLALDKKENEELRRWFWEDYLPRGLSTGRVVPTRVLVAEGGLGGVQEVLDRLAAGGVSGRKFVLNPQA
jgi:NADPH:quinone reductase-like Zn-dependent oxidoreductase